MSSTVAEVMISGIVLVIVGSIRFHAEEGGYGGLSWVPAAIWFLLGGVFLRMTDRIVPICTWVNRWNTREGPGPKLPTNLLFLASRHNIPEGLAVGVGFGAVRQPAYPRIIHY